MRQIFHQPVNLEDFPIFEKIKDEKVPGYIEHMKKTKDMQRGDLVILHVGKHREDIAKSGVYAWGIITQPCVFLKDSPDDVKCNNSWCCEVEIQRLWRGKPVIPAAEYKQFNNFYRKVHKLDPKHYPTLIKKLNIKLK